MIYETERGRIDVPVIPGPDGARRPAAGRPGHLERLLSDAPRGSWPLADRYRATREIGPWEWTDTLR
jgi:hypothetical protein